MVTLDGVSVSTHQEIFSTNVDFTPGKLKGSSAEKILRFQLCRIWASCLSSFTEESSHGLSDGGQSSALQKYHILPDKHIAVH